LLQGGLDSKPATVGGDSRPTLQRGVEPAPSLVLNGTLTDRDLNRLFERTFAVPAGTSAVDIRVDYTAESERTVIDVGIRDPHGIRGWSGGRREPIHLDATSATLGYRPGAIEPGPWAVILGVPNIRAGVESRYSISVRLANRGSGSSQPTLRRTAGWYVGDLHTHSGHSDGYRNDSTNHRWPVAVADLAAAATRAGLDFLSISDHNTDSHWADVDRVQPASPVLLLHSREVTTYRGHVNATGETRFTDFRIGPSRPMAAMLTDLGNDRAFLSINHPWLPDDERCMGCGWLDRDGETMRHVRGVEVANGDADSVASGWLFWAEMLNRGMPLVAVGGSDSHNPDLRSVGLPATVVWADELSEDAIVRGLKSGRVYVRTARSDRPALEFSASAPGQPDVMMGGTIQAGDTILRAHVIGASTQRGRWFRRGELLKEEAIDSDDATLTLTIAARPSDWFSLVLYDGERPTLVSNPIHVR